MWSTAIGAAVRPWSEAWRDLVQSLPFEVCDLAELGWVYPNLNHLCFGTKLVESLVIEVGVGAKFVESLPVRVGLELVFWNKLG